MAGQQRFLAQLLVSLLNAREAEGARVSRLLHDQVGQVLSAVGLHLTVVRMDLQDREPEAVQQTLEIQNMLEQAVTLVRELSYELNPDIVARVGLHYALERLLSRFREHYSGTLRLHNTLTSPLPVEVATAIYKIADQAIDNAIRHANATQIQVALKSANGQVLLEVKDNGQGFVVDSATEAPAGLGLLLMNHHAEQAGLKFSIKSSAKRGTIVKAVFPLVTVSPKPDESVSQHPVEQPERK